MERAEARQQERLQTSLAVVLPRGTRAAVALVFLHGLGTGPEAWRPQIEAFRNDQEPIVPRLDLDRGFTIAGAADRLLGGLPAEPLDVCGLSLGALVALRMALARPEQVRRLALCAGFASLPIPFRAIQAVAGTFAALSPGKALDGLDRAAIRAVFREGRAFDVSHELGRLTMPVLVLVGERDRPNRGLSVALTAALPNAELKVISSAGHVANLDAPDEFTALLRTFLAG